MNTHREREDPGFLRKIAPRAALVLGLERWKELTGDSDINRSEPQGSFRREACPEAAVSKGTTAGTRIGSEAGHGR